MREKEANSQTIGRPSKRRRADFCNDFCNSHLNCARLLKLMFVPVADLCRISIE